MIDTAAILLTSLLVLFIAIRATMLDARERSGAVESDEPATSSGDRD
jgi:hypothetical protein